MLIWKIAPFLLAGLVLLAVLLIFRLLPRYVERKLEPAELPENFDDDLADMNGGSDCPGCGMTNTLLGNGFLPSTCHFCGRSLENQTSWDLYKGR